MCMEFLRITLLVLLCFICDPAAAFLQQYVGVRGRLMCGKLPLPDTTVTLWDDNVIASDVLLAATKTDRNGRFELEGGTSALFTMDVRLKVNHNCNEKRFSLGCDDNRKVKP
ncbi:Transthyretin-like family protein [Ancylostoma duodenale]|uniref:Transthyretin-like family protein n=1 Tax=Ancylostoma duodenale TaxID=51022 RepID=A0A0C2DN92_9BILA|nr:Transthyretin-like family protein [Ancylostoma duodenale]